MRILYIAEDQKPGYFLSFPNLLSLLPLLGKECFSSKETAAQNSPKQFHVQITILPEVEEKVLEKEKQEEQFSH